MILRSRLLYIIRLGKDFNRLSARHGKYAGPSFADKFASASVTQALVLVRSKANGHIDENNLALMLSNGRIYSSDVGLYKVARLAGPIQTDTNPATLAAIHTPPGKTLSILPHPSISQITPTVAQDYINIHTQG